MSCQFELFAAFMWCSLRHLIKPKASYLPKRLETTVSLKLLVLGKDISCVCLSLSMALNYTVCSDCCAGKHLCQPLGRVMWLCVYLWEWAAGCSLAQPAKPCWFSAHRALCAVNNMVPFAKGPGQGQEGGQDASKKEKMSASEILNQQTG